MIELREQLELIRLKERIAFNAKMNNRLVKLLGQSKGWDELGEDWKLSRSMIRGLKDMAVCELCYKKSDWVATKGFAFAGFAVFAYPDGIELVHGLLHQFGIVGEDARFEVASAVAFHADACAGEVGAADVGNLVIKNQDLEMYPWTKCSFKAIITEIIPS